MQDLFRNYVDDLIKFREAFHEELAATAAELSKAMGDYSQRSEAALTSFMEKVSARGEALEAAAAARLDQFRVSLQKAIFRLRGSRAWQNGRSWTP